MIENKYIGIVLNEPSGDNNTIKVWIPELAPFTTGNPLEVANRKPEITNHAPGGPVPSNVVAISYVYADFLNDPFNVPNIKPGEQVTITVVEDNDNSYLWSELERDRFLRTNELYKIYAVNKPNQLDPLSDDYIYCVELDTRPATRGIRVKTSKGTGEEVSYDFVFDTVNYKATLQDSVGNIFNLDSKGKTWMVANANGDSHTVAPDNIITKTKTYDIIADTTNISGLLNVMSDTTLNALLTVEGVGVFNAGLNSMANIFSAADIGTSAMTLNTHMGHFWPVNGPAAGPPGVPNVAVPAGASSGGASDSGGSSSDGAYTPPEGSLDNDGLNERINRLAEAKAETIFEARKQDLLNEVQRMIDDEFSSRSGIGDG